MRYWSLNVAEPLGLEARWTLLSTANMRTLNPESCHTSLQFSCLVPTYMLSVLTEPFIPLFAHKIVGYNCITINAKYPNYPTIKCVYLKK